MTVNAYLRSRLVKLGHSRAMINRILKLWRLEREAIYNLTNGKHGKNTAKTK